MYLASFRAQAGTVHDPYRLFGFNSLILDNMQPTSTSQKANGSLCGGWRLGIINF